MMRARVFCAAVMLLLIAAVASAETVYVTKTGSKYHRASCQHLSKSSTAIELSDAIARGYEPCKTCRPPTAVAAQTPAKAAPAAASQVSQHLELSGKVVGVHDGDTLTLLAGTTQHRIRLNGIDAPEPGQPYNQRAKQALSGLCFGVVVRVVVLDVDRYGREISDVYVGEMLVNAELVRAGLAWHFKKYSRDPVLAALETDARFEGRGLWADAAPVPPWDYRRE